MNSIDLPSLDMDQDFEHLIDYSKKSLNSDIDPDLSKTLKKLDKQIQSEIKAFKSKKPSELLIYFKFLKKITKKFKKANNLLDIIEADPRFNEVDTASELDILLSHLKKIVNKTPKKANFKKLEADIEKMEQIEDQKKRVIMTYLMEDWKNLDVALNLMKLGEIYHDIADDLLSISIFKD